MDTIQVFIDAVDKMISDIEEITDDEVYSILSERITTEFNTKVKNSMSTELLNLRMELSKIEPDGETEPFVKRLDDQVKRMNYLVNNIEICIKKKDTT